MPSRRNKVRTPKRAARHQRDVVLRLPGSKGGAAQSGGVHRFVRWTGSDHLTITAVSASLGSLALNNSGLLTLSTTAVQAVSFYSLSFGFCLADLPSVADFTGLFDRYRFAAVEVRLTPFFTTTNAPMAAGNGSAGGFLHSCVDYDDVGLLAAGQAGIDSMRARPSYRTMNIASRETYRWVVKPRVAIPAYESATFSGYSNAAAPWVDTISSNVEHYGMKYIFEVANTSAVVQFISFKMELVYHLDFTDVK
jgi:hypothetical protein